jgi:uridine kinase
MSERVINYPEFEQNKHREIEKKYLPVFPEHMKRFMDEVDTIEQCYLSHTSEDFSLRIREVTEKHGVTEYTATLKSRGDMTDEGLDRLEVEIGIDKAIYDYYKASEHVPLHKYRAHPMLHVVVDFYADGHVQCEAEENAAWQKFTELCGDAFVDITAESFASNEWRAHLQYRKNHEGREALASPQSLNGAVLASRIIDQLATEQTVIMRIAGRSGSGKSTILRDIVAELAAQGIESTTLSTDDYHRGKTWLEHYKGGEWTEWDAPIVYDVEALASDLHSLQHGNPIQKRWFDFTTEEPAYSEVVPPRRVILVEGIYAKSPLLDSVSDLLYEVPTPLATCVGRRLLRDMRERPQFADPEKSLRYILEQAEPAYRAQ